MVLSLNSLATCPPASHSASPWQETHHDVRVIQSLLFPLLSKSHEKAEKIALCLLRWLSQHKELIGRHSLNSMVPRVGPGLMFTLTTVSDSQGQEHTSTECPTSFSKLAERLWHGWWAATVVRLPLSHKQTTDGFVCCVSQWLLEGSACYLFFFWDYLAHYDYVRYSQTSNWVQRAKQSSSRWGVPQKKLLVNKIECKGLFCLPDIFREVQGCKFQERQWCHLLSESARRAEVWGQQQSELRAMLPKSFLSPSWLVCGFVWMRMAPMDEHVWIWTGGMAWKEEVWVGVTEL